MDYGKHCASLVNQLFITNRMSTTTL